MNNKRIIYFLIVAFIAGNVLLIYIQYNSAKNINSLIDGNEKVLAEIGVANNLRELNRDIVQAENNLSGVFTSKDSANLKDVEAKTKMVQYDIDNLHKISDDDSSVKYIGTLDLLVHKKLFFSKDALDTMRLLLNNRAESAFVINRSKQLDDSIRLVTRKIENSRQQLLAKITSSINQSGKKALSFGTTLIVFVLFCGAILFWIIIITIIKQNKLIHALNVTEKKVRETAQIKENFMANMSHEIRTPMNAILGFTNLLKQKKMDDTSKEYVETIRHSSENLLMIINDILDLSKIEAGMIRIEPVPFSIRGLVHSVETMFRANASEKQLQFIVDIDKTLPDILEGDTTRLTQILINLISNALKFTQRGSITLKITNQEKIDAHINVGITVSDTGIGIEKNKLNQIFDRFQQAEDSITRKYGGTGLGLSIVKDLVLLQDGNIDVESEIGKGTTFNIMIPYKICLEQFDNKLINEKDFAAKPNFENVCVLVVEDNTINQSLIKHFFKSWHLEYDLAKNGVEAIEKIKIKKYDLVLMDIQMPQMDGYTTAKQIRDLLKLKTPIIAMTAHALAGEREKCLSFGMTDYISKPLREELLLQLIVQYTQLKRFPGPSNSSDIKTDPGAFKYINLNYMKEVSNGNIEYEKTVTAQFIEAIPEDLQAIETTWQQHEIIKMQQIAHNMKTSVSVMGINELLLPYLDVIELQNISDKDFQQNFSALKFICTEALEEAKKFYDTL
ncbi:MAG: response regulator [Bacteroidota bacterium]|nr:response regulator [Bacteroidota bacterium]